MRKLSICKVNSLILIYTMRNIAVKIKKISVLLHNFKLKSLNLQNKRTKLIIDEETNYYLDIITFVDNHG